MRAFFGSHPDAAIPISNNQSEASLRNSLSCHAWPHGMRCALEPSTALGGTAIDWRKFS
jgi:hypothetical protein